MRPGAKKSAVWNHFKKNEDGKSATCTFCKKSIKCFGGTTNLKQHLVRIHPTQILDETPQEETATENSENTEKNTDSGDLSESTTSGAIVKENIDQLAIPGPSGVPKRPNKEKVDISERPRKQLKLFGARKLNELSEVDIKNIDKKVLNLVTKDFQPLSIVENEGFLEYTRALQPLYKPPNRKKLSYEILPKYYTESASALKTILNEVENITVTTDIWTSDSNVAYITVTGHFIFKDELWARVLATRDLPGSHTSENIAIALNSIFNEWNIDNKIMTVVSDNGANIKKAIGDNLQKFHHPCVAHTLNLSVTEAISKNERLSAILKKCRALVGHFKHSVVASDKLKLVQEQMNMPLLKIKQDVSTRWNSCYIMLERLLAIKDALSVVVSNIPKCPEYLDAEEWAIISGCVQVLKPAYHLTTILCGEKYPTISIIVPLIRGFQHAMARLPVESDAGERLKTSLQDIVTRRLGILEKNKIVSKATFLDPRFKKIAFGCEENATNAQTWISQELSNLISRKQRAAQAEEAAIIEPENPSSSSNYSDLWAHFDTKLLGRKSLFTPMSTVTLIIRQYIEMPPIDRKTNPLEFWKKHKLLFPELYELAMKYLCIPSTSVPSERVFSKTGQLTNLRRNRLGPKNLDKIIFLNSCS